MTSLDWPHFYPLINPTEENRMLIQAKPRLCDHYGDPWVERTVIGSPTTILGDVGEKSCAGEIIAAIFPFFFFFFFTPSVHLWQSKWVLSRFWRNERKIRIRTELTYRKRKSGNVLVSQKLYLDPTMLFYILKPFEFPVAKSFNFLKKKQEISTQNHIQKICYLTSCPFSKYILSASSRLKHEVEGKYTLSEGNWNVFPLYLKKMLILQRK